MHTLTNYTACAVLIVATYSLASTVSIHAFHCPSLQQVFHHEPMRSAWGVVEGHRL